MQKIDFLHDVEFRCKMTVGVHFTKELGSSEQYWARYGPNKVFWNNISSNFFDIFARCFTPFCIFFKKVKLAKNPPSPWEFPNIVVFSHNFPFILTFPRGTLCAGSEPGPPNIGEEA